jgi:hypothetical protein
MQDPTASTPLLRDANVIAAFAGGTRESGATMKFRNGEMPVPYSNRNGGPVDQNRELAACYEEEGCPAERDHVMQHRSENDRGQAKRQENL